MSKTYQNFMKNKFEKLKSNKYKKQKQKFKEGEYYDDEHVKETSHQVGGEETQPKTENKKRKTYRKEFEDVRAVYEESNSNKHL